MSDQLPYLICIFGESGQSRQCRPRSMSCHRMWHLIRYYTVCHSAILHYENMPISNIQKISPPKTENFQIKTDIFHVSAQNIDCGYSLEPPRRGGSNEYPQSMCFARNKKNNVYPCKPQCYYIKVGF